MRIAVVLIGRHSVDPRGVVAAVSSQVRCTATSAFLLRGMSREFSRVNQHSVIVNICLYFCDRWFVTDVALKAS